MASWTDSKRNNFGSDSIVYKESNTYSTVKITYSKDNLKEKYPGPSTANILSSLVEEAEIKLKTAKNS